MNTYIALLRGINVGGKNMLPMKPLVALLSDKNIYDAEPTLYNIRTYLQTGNIIFQSIKSKEVIQEVLSGVIEKNFAFKPEILILNTEEFNVAIQRNPYQDKAGNTCLFYFCKEEPNLDIVRLNKLITTTENYQLQDSVFYLHAPDGIGKSKLVKHIESCLAVKATARNLNTVKKIAHLCS